MLGRWPRPAALTTDGRLSGIGDASGEPFAPGLGASMAGRLSLPISARVIGDMPAKILCESTWPGRVTLRHEMLVLACRARWSSPKSWSLEPDATLALGPAGP